MGIVGGYGVPNCKRLPPVGSVAPFGVVYAAAVADVVVAAAAATAVDATVVANVAAFVPSVVALVVCDALPLGGRSVLVSW